MKNQRRWFGSICLLILTLALSSGAPAQPAPNQNLTQHDLSPFRTIAEDTLAIVSTGNLRRAKSRASDLEKSWDRAEATLRPRNPEQWRAIDRAIDLALLQLRADNPQVANAREAWQALLGELDQPNKRGGAAPRQAAVAASAKVSIADVIAMLEKSRADETVLDVSFEPKDSQPAYAVRTYAKGKVWDGLVDGMTGALSGDGSLTDESALDDEDKAEVTALGRGKITLRQALETAEKANGGRALSAGLEQVRGRVVWEVLFQDAKHPQVRIDPVSGKIL